MQLSLFIVASLDTLVDEWQASGRASAPALSRSEADELRDCRRGVLRAIAGELASDGVADASRLEAMVAPGAADGRPCTRHGRLRQQHGIGVGQLVEEFGSLRASVLARWHFSGARKDSAAVLDQGLRFNQAVDAALRESAEGFTQAMTAARDAYLFTLAQDLRQPLSAIHVASAVLARPDFGSQTRRNASRRVKAALVEIDGSISDLLEYTRRRSAPGIAVDPFPCDLTHVCEAAIDAVGASHPARRFELAASGDLVLCADASRVQQALANLLHNAVQHGDGQSAVRLEASADPAGASLSVWNAGRAIPEAALEAIFEPRVRAPGDASSGADRLPPSVGLGLFIAREIALAHGGEITATSSAAAGTRFTIWIPRVAACEATAASRAGADARQVAPHASGPMLTTSLRVRPGSMHEI
jgi:signal transduction histidine kinase